MRTTIVHALDELASLHTHPPFDCGLRSVSMTRSTMSLQGQAEQPMMLRGRGVSSTVPDAPAPWPWTRAVGRVALAKAAGRGILDELNTLNVSHDFIDDDSLVTQLQIITQV